MQLTRMVRVVADALPELANVNGWSLYGGQQGPYIEFQAFLYRLSTEV